MPFLNDSLKQQLKNLPEGPGVYQFLDKKGEVLYVGKASNLKERVMSYFREGSEVRPQVLAILPQISEIKTLPTNSEIEAIFLEASLIKKLKPKANIAQRDDKSFLMLAISKDNFPRVFFLRERELAKKISEIQEVFGPFPSGGVVRKALRMVRKVVSFRDCSQNKFQFYQKKGRPCLYGFLKVCPAPCVGRISEKDYQQKIHLLKKILTGQNLEVLLELEERMKESAQKQDFETAATLRNSLQALSELLKTTFLFEEQGSLKRIEGFDISNISGSQAVGSMVVFCGSNPQSDFYRRFKIQSVSKADDLKMLKEVLERRLSETVEKSSKESAWPVPDLWIIDGGKNQLKVATSVRDSFGFDFPIVAIAKGPKRKKADLYYSQEDIEKIKKTFTTDLAFLEQLARRVRDEAHRFALSYHLKLRSKQLLTSWLADIKGIGPKTYQKLMLHFGSLEGLKKANIESLSNLVGRKKAKIIKESLKSLQ